MGDRQKQAYEKKVAKGLLRRSYWATQENHEKIKKYVKRLEEIKPKGKQL